MIFAFLAGAGILGLLAMGNKSKAPINAQAKIAAEESTTAKQALAKVDAGKSLTPKEAAALIAVHPLSPEAAKTREAATVEAAQEIAAIQSGASKNFQAAIAAALEARSKSAVEAIAEELEDLGRDQEAADLRSALSNLVSLDAARLKALPPVETLAAMAESETPIIAPKPLPPPSVAVEPEPEPEPETEESEPDPELELAKEMLLMLAQSSRYKEDKALVTEYQTAMGLGSDGKYGPGTAKSVYEEFDLLPVNPFYWSADSAKRSAQLSDYRRFLLAIKTERPELGATVDRLLSTLGR